MIFLHQTSSYSAHVATSPQGAPGALLLASFAYLAMSVGGVGLGEDINPLRLALAPTWVIGIVLVLLNLKTLMVQKTVLVLLLAVTSFVLLQALRTTSPDITLLKLDGFLIAGWSVFLLSALGVQRYGFGFIAQFVNIGLTVLLLTIAYKLATGFWDRQTRFFLNGPIVFGWLMAVMALFSLHLFIERKRWLFILLIAVFFAAVLWTQSKGPMVGVFVAMATYLMNRGKVGMFLLSITVLVLTIFILLEYNLLPSRFYALYRALTGEITDLDFGSVYIRRMMLTESFEIFQQYPIGGVGLGNWSLHSLTALQEGHFTYPHNIAGEILAEHGLIGGTVFGGSILFTFLQCAPLGRAVFILFMISLMFSGDMQYWRFLLFLPLALTSGDISYERKSE